MSDWDSFETFLADVEALDDAEQRQKLVDTLLSQRPHWPWIEPNRATFVYSQMGTQSAALNLDTIKSDPPFDPMHHIEGTTLWYLTRAFEPDDLLDYMLAINDPMTPLAQERNLVERVTQHWQPDPLNPVALKTAQINVSVLRMPQARPFPDWSAMPEVARGEVRELSINSRQLNFTDRKLWIYTPPGYDPYKEYPLLILMDGAWCTGPLQVPLVADTLIKHRRVQPLVIAMMQSAGQDQRPAEFIANDRHVLFILTELLPLLQSQYSLNPLNLGVGGVDLGALAAAHVALVSMTAFQHLLMISPPLQGSSPAEEAMQHFRRRFESAPTLPKRIFQSVGRYETFNRFLKPGRRLAESIRKRGDLAYQFTEVGSGHSLVGFKGIFPEALTWTFPAEEG